MENEKTKRRVGRPTRIPTHKIENIIISKIAMDTLNLSIFDAVLLDVIYQYQRHEKVVKGFCVESKVQIAADTYVTDTCVLNYIKKLEAQGLLIREAENAIQVTKKYLLALIPTSNMKG